MHSNGDATAQHDAIRQVMGGLVVCPIDITQPGIRILDSGTCDGYWLQDLVNCYSLRKHDAVLIGTDITDAKFPSSSQNTYTTTTTTAADENNGDTSLPAITFQLQSISQPWPEDWNGTFDLVHQRLVLGGCGAAIPFGQAVRNLAALVRPGGWVQLVEPDQTCGVRDGPAMNNFLTLVTWVFEDMGGHARYAYGIAAWLREAGFEDVREESVPLFLGRAIRGDEELARRTARSTADAMVPLLKYVEKSGKNPPLCREELDTLVSRLHDELMENGGLHPLRVIYGRAPSA
ncbi:S-adenosyl-L-methionine-dependent methyltransferase [Xylariaceae sp. FL0594]|nr:S-adenosyl-L-methionine-dependent methyltransferase [Xylariaceae sp. FL0594]